MLLRGTRIALATLLTGMLALLTTIPGAAQGTVRDAAKLLQEAEQIDADATRADATGVEERIASQFPTLTVKMTPTDTPHRLGVADVQALRSTGLGYGEIVIVVALYANRPGSRFGSVEQVLALRQAGQGWGQVAKAMGYDSLGTVLRDVKRSGHAVHSVARSEAPDASSRADQVQAAEKPDRPEKPDKPERPARMERPERPERPEKRSR